MSVQINCDRCGADTRLRFANVEIDITRGRYASIEEPSFRPRWRKNWHLCYPCIDSLKQWAEGARVMSSVSPLPEWLA